MTRTTKEAFITATCLIALFGVIKHATQLFPIATDIAFVLAFLFQVFVPIHLIDRERKKLSDYKLAFLEIDKSTLWKDHLSDLKNVFFLSMIVFLPYWVAFHLWFQFFPAQYPADTQFSWLNFVLTQFLLVALAEEVFYRGFLQNRLLQAWPNQTFFFGLPVGRAIILTNLFFAAGHFVGDYHVSRLAPFFPGFLFSFLAFRSNSIFGAVVFHALCNIFGQLLFVAYYWK